MGKIENGTCRRRNLIDGFEEEDIDDDEVIDEGPDCPEYTFSCHSRARPLTPRLQSSEMMQKKALAFLKDDLEYCGFGVSPGFSTTNIIKNIKVSS